jgi:nucleotide-binding universal stress UspA family protein
MNLDIIISYDGTENDHDALALGRLFADAGATVSLAYVRHTRESEGRREQLAQDEADRMLQRGAQWLGLPDAERHVVLSGSTGEGLWQLAKSEQADLVIFGSDSHTAPGHVQLGRSALRLLEGGPVAVAIAPARLRDRADASLDQVALAGGDVDPAARATAEALAERSETELATPAQAGVDLLVIGSRPGTAAGHVGISAASEYLLDTALAPVLVLPRAVELPVRASLAW